MVKRIQYLDIAKGIGILLVVLAHNDLGAYHPFLHQFIYSFHMPLFFFLSGMFFKPERKFTDLLKHRFYGLMKPFFFALFLIYGISVFFGKMGFAMALGRLGKALYMTGPYLNWTQLWFLPHLFVINIYAFIFYRLLRPVTKTWIRWTILLVTLWIGYLILPYFWTFSIDIFGKSPSLYGLPASLDLVLLTGFFFMLGRETIRHAPEKFFASKITLVVSTVLIFGLNLRYKVPLDFDIRLYTSLPINTLEAMAGITFILSLSSQIDAYSNKLARLFKFIGSMTLSILVFQVPIQEMTGSKLTPFIGQNDLTVLLAFLMGVAGPIFIHKVFIKPNPVVGAWFGIKKTPPEAE
ncbi:MAG: acyltransferase family protein [Anaerolineales bacterium]|nr:acyltransferase family protein [Anaerolineales bacterium]